jgi:soluble lytic murein transglycosylase
MPAALNRVEALYTVGLTHYRMEEHDQAVRFWDAASSEFPEHPSGIRAALWAGHSLQRAGRFPEAVARYEAFIARYPRDEQVESAYRNAIDSWRSAGDSAKALTWCQRAEAAQPGSALATFAAFNRAKIRLTAGDTAGALADFARLKQGYSLRASGPGLPSPGEVDLLRAVCLERLGRTQEAIAAYLAIRAGRDAYFGNRATERMIALGKSPKGRSEIGRLLRASVSAATSARSTANANAAKDAAERALRLTDDDGTRRSMLEVLRWAYGELPAYSRVSAPSLEAVGRSEIAGKRTVSERSHAALADELAFLGLWDEAAPELASSGFGTRSPFSMAVYNARGTRADGAVQLGESIVAKLPDDFRVELLPRAVAELVYPAPYADALRAYAIPIDVDPRFELSIARQESRFQPWVKSAAAARGLMQFIPETASRIAASLNLAPFDQDDLYDPRIAVRIGARYLADLYVLFPANHAAVAASYNGGEDNVARWMKRSADASDVDLVVAEISFKESKGYVFKVMNNFWAYQALYSRDLGPR